MSVARDQKAFGPGSKTSEVEDPIRRCHRPREDRVITLENGEDHDDELKENRKID
jgi:hypothetical protein